VSLAKMPLRVTCASIVSSTKRSKYPSIQIVLLFAINAPRRSTPLR
jgi:hypothetical protein